MAGDARFERTDLEVGIDEYSKSVGIEELVEIRRKLWGLSVRSFRVNEVRKAAVNTEHVVSAYLPKTEVDGTLPDVQTAVGDIAG